MNSRLTQLLRDHALVPEEGRIVVFGAPADFDSSALPMDRLDCVQGLFPDAARLQARGINVLQRPEGPYALAIVCVPRAKALAQAWIKEAARVVKTGTVIVDGQKTDGIESLLKHCRKRLSILGQVSKAHGKGFWFPADPAFSDWGGPDPRLCDDGYWRAPGVFSADGIDPASRALVESLPKTLGKSIADLGAGWGFLAKDILTRDSVDTLHLVEADHSALACAKLSIDDPRAQFHWADATDWKPQAAVDCVVMNPPFHTGRAADPDLGRAFIRTARRILKPTGQLFMVANRHLPYEATISECFGQMAEISGDNRFKILHAQKPSRLRR